MMSATTTAAATTATTATTATIATVPTVPTTPEYTLLSTGYTTAKQTWEASKDYVVVSSVLPLVESCGEKCLEVTGKYTSVSSLTELDQRVSPALSTADAELSPYVSTVVSKAEETANSAPVKAVEERLPVEAVAGYGYAAYGIVMKNLSKISEALKVQKTETVVEPVQ